MDRGGHPTSTSGLYGNSHKYTHARAHTHMCEGWGEDKVWTQSHRKEILVDVHPLVHRWSCDDGGRDLESTHCRNHQKLDKRTGEWLSWSRHLLPVLTENQKTHRHPGEETEAYRGECLLPKPSEPQLLHLQTKDNYPCPVCFPELRSGCQ